jgi:hypothetical protein
MNIVVWELSQIDLKDNFKSVRLGIYSSERKVKLNAAENNFLYNVHNIANDRSRKTIKTGSKQSKMKFMEFKAVDRVVYCKNKQNPKSTDFSFFIEILEIL